LTIEALQRAIELNGVQVGSNLESFAWGRAAICAPDSIAQANQDVDVPKTLPNDLASLVARRSEFLTKYQDRAYAERYQNLVQRAAHAENALGGGEEFTKAVAGSYFKLLANKDAFEVARLYTTPEFRADLNRQFEGAYKLRLHLGLWPFSKRNAGGQLMKGEVGSWIFPVLRALAGLRRLRNTWADPLRHTEERRLDNSILAEFESDMQKLIENMGPTSHSVATALADLPRKIRGFGHIKHANAVTVAAERAALWEQLQRSVAALDTV
jgi:indolepyruvate ferredoxin oxidoreductase